MKNLAYLKDKENQKVLYVKLHLKKKKKLRIK